MATLLFCVLVALAAFAVFFRPARPSDSVVITIEREQAPAPAAGCGPIVLVLIALIILLSLTQ